MDSELRAQMLRAAYEAALADHARRQEVEEAGRKAEAHNVSERKEAALNAAYAEAEAQKEVDTRPAELTELREALAELEEAYTEVSGSLRGVIEAQIAETQEAAENLEAELIEDGYLINDDGEAEGATDEEIILVAEEAVAAADEEADAEAEAERPEGWVMDVDVTNAAGETATFTVLEGESGGAWSRDYPTLGDVISEIEKVADSIGMAYAAQFFEIYYDDEYDTWQLVRNYMDSEDRT